MPLPEQFALWCLEFVSYDLSCSLQTIISLARLESDIAWLIKWLPDPGDPAEQRFRKRGERSEEELKNTSLRDVILHMLDYRLVRISDTEIGWFLPYGAPLPKAWADVTGCNPHFGPRTPRNRQLRRILQSELATKPEALRKAISEADLQLEA